MSRQRFTDDDRTTLDRVHAGLLVLRQEMATANELQAREVDTLRTALADAIKERDAYAASRDAQFNEAAQVRGIYDELLASRNALLGEKAWVTGELRARTASVAALKGQLTRAKANMQEQAEQRDPGMWAYVTQDGDSFKLLLSVDPAHLDAVPGKSVIEAFAGIAYERVMQDARAAETRSDGLGQFMQEPQAEQEHAEPTGAAERREARTKGPGVGDPAYQGTGKPKPRKRTAKVVPKPRKRT